MKDRLLFLTIGMLIGVVVIQWGFDSDSPAVTSAIAGYVQSSETGIVASDGTAHLDQYGVVWSLTPLDGYPGWHQRNQPDAVLPVPVSEIKFWSKIVIITNENVYWAWDGVTETWINYGPWPGGPPVPTDRQSWGDLKNKYKQEGK